MQIQNLEQQMQSKSAMLDDYKQKYTSAKDAQEKEQLNLEKKSNECETALSRHREISGQLQNLQMRIDALQKEKTGK